ncbi:MAG: hypothetical protein E6J64_21425 [Deltaproteobacteria bacterium]|nr:MAG: hypothetical protein E6J64_21425 [Deltaproteobacteria bacterium]
MEHGNMWRVPAMLFFLGTLAMLLAGAWRELEMPVRPATIVSEPAAEQPNRGEPQSNEIADFPQLG